MSTRLTDVYFERLALGKLRGITRISKFGRNAAVGALEVLLTAGGIYGLPATADTVIATSTSGLDIPAGAGARELAIYGLDADGKSIFERVIMGNTSIKRFIRVFRVRVIRAGTVIPVAGGNQGTITITQTGGTPMIVAPAFEGSSLCACFTVPKGYTALIWSADTTAGEGKDSTNRLKIRKYTDLEAPFTTEAIRDNFQNQVGRDIIIPTRVDELTDIIFTCLSSAAGTSVSGAFVLQLIETEVYR